VTEGITYHISLSPFVSRALVSRFSFRRHVVPPSVFDLGQLCMAALGEFLSGAQWAVNIALEIYYEAY